MKIFFGHSLETSLAISALLIISSCISASEPIEIVINEVMYGPKSGEPEWIELYNRSAGSLYLNGWTIEDADSTKPRMLANRPMLINSYSYICVVQDSSAFLALFPTISCPVLQPLKGWPRLNNDGDRIVLRDPMGEVIDEVDYNNHWGGGDGKSLERIHPRWPSNNPQTWSSSVSLSQSTPCNQNSIFSSSFANEATISADPDPFDTKTSISYKLTVPTAIVKLYIYDIRGRLVKRLIDQESSGSCGSVLWDGKNDNGRSLKIGVYIVYLEAINAQMGVLDRGKKTITLVKKLD